MSVKIDTGRIPTAEELNLAPEIYWYMLDRGFDLPEMWQRPIIATPPPTGEDVIFSAERVDKVIRVFRALRHTQGIWANKPLEPSPWQVAYIICPIFGWVKANPQSRDGYLRVVREAYVEVPRKQGKLLWIEEPILASDGWKRFGDLKLGDQVHAEDGSLASVTFISDIEYPDCYRVTFADGQSVVAGAEHLWRLDDRVKSRNRKTSDPYWVTIDTATMADSYMIQRSDGRREYRYSVSTQRVIDRPHVSGLPLDPYALGVWLGDGATDGARISTADPEVLEVFSKSGYTVRRVAGTENEYGVSGGLLAALRELGVLGNKHVPEEYLLASADQRLALLQGLMDTDGTVSLSGPNKKPACEFVSTREYLAESVVFLARSLGWKPTLREGVARLNGRDMGPKYRVQFAAYRDRPPFRLYRHRIELLGDKPERRTRSETNKIVSVERVPTVPSQCIQVDHPSHQFLVGKGLIPTHNTTIAGGVGIYMTTADDEPGAQVVVAATTREQAGYCFNPVALLAESSPSLARHVTLYRSSRKIIHNKTGSYFQAIANVAAAQHGSNIHCGIVDELHLHEDAMLVEALETGTGARSQPLMFFITTADEGKPGTVYARKRKMIERIADRVLTDESVYGVIWAAAREEAKLYDPYCVESQMAANPGYGVSPKAEYLAGKAKRAKESPAELGTYLRLHLGIRTKQTTRFISLAEWDESGGTINQDSLLGRECHGGLDVASVSDIAAFCMTFPNHETDTYDNIWRLFLPEEAFRSLDRRTSGNAQQWVDQGLLTLTPGNVIDNRSIVNQILADGKKYDIVTIGYDRWGANDIVRRLDDDGITCVPITQGYASLSGPFKELLRLVKSKRYIHGGNPVLRWMVDNLSVAEDPAGNVKPDKSKSAEKIDGVSAAVMALSEALAAEEETMSADSMTLSDFDDKEGEGKPSW